MRIDIFYGVVFYLIACVPFFYLAYQLLSQHPKLRPKLAWAIDLLSRPDELVALIRYMSNKSGKIPEDIPQDEQFCYQILQHVSRSFAAVILEINRELRLPICIFYLVCRALDTIEDDTTIPLNLKLKELNDFHKRLQQPEWCSRNGYGAPNIYEMQLLENFSKVTSVYSRLKESYRVVISDITFKMGSGMAEYQTKSVDTNEDYDNYCFYVAGLVGLGLSKLFYHSGLEKASIGKNEDMAIAMGLFLQKTNITRDYLEDISQRPPRVFYPKSIWSKYVERVVDLSCSSKTEEALFCLNDMVTNALLHIPDCIKYMSCIEDKSVFRFCAIPQIMAIATLERCYNNRGVFTGIVKIRKGEAAKLILSCRDFHALLNIFDSYLRKLKGKILPKDPNAKLTHERLATAFGYIELARQHQKQKLI